jgi:hypothetical protein
VNTVRVFLAKDKSSVIDSESWELVSLFPWWAINSSGRLYAISYQRPAILMHRLLLDCPDDLFVDHKNGDGLDNRMQNLRICTHAENMRNRKRCSNCSSRFKGVHWDSHEKKWRAKIGLDGRYVRLGRFNSETQAALAYDKAARQFHGEFARVNFPLNSEEACAITI